MRGHQTGGLTRNTGVGSSSLEKALPEPSIVENISPTIMVPVGTNIVFFTRYIPASKTVEKVTLDACEHQDFLHIIPHPEFYDNINTAFLW